MRNHASWGSLNDVMISFPQSGYMIGFRPEQRRRITEQEEESGKEVAGKSCPKGMIRLARKTKIGRQGMPRTEGERKDIVGETEGMSTSPWLENSSDLAAIISKTGEIVTTCQHSKAGGLICGRWIFANVKPVATHKMNTQLGWHGNGIRKGKNIFILEGTMQKMNASSGD